VNITSTDEFRQTALRVMFSKRYHDTRDRRERQKIVQQAEQVGISQSDLWEDRGELAQAERQCGNYLVRLHGNTLRERTLAAVCAKSLRHLAEGVAALSRARGLKTSQIRNFFGQVRKVALRFRSHGFDQDEVEYLRVLLVYAHGRHQQALQFFYFACDRMLDRVTGRNDFERFLKALEAIVAYHKFYGGED